MLNFFFFFFISFIMLFSSFLVISCINPIKSLLSLILLFISSTILLLYLNIEFLALMFLIVYVGAIAVLFLFVVMMLNIRLIEINENLLKYLPIGLVLFFIFILDFFLIFSLNLVDIFDYNYINYINWINLVVGNNSNMELLGQIIYNYYFFLFIFCSLILFIAMLGPIVLTLSILKSKFNKKQDIFKQINAKYNLNLKLENND